MRPDVRVIQGLTSSRAHLIWELVQRVQAPSARTFSHDLFAGLSRTRFNGFVGGLDDVMTRLRELSALVTAATSTAAAPAMGDGNG